ncbi:urea carboxylase [Sphingomonas sp. R86520]|uniref:urea carboxylase n=1 Tax=Sphingomonas sp. R86520 TaxID=3093859 RepID=UPI0036D33632
MFHTVLVANRGAIACRIIRTLRRMGIRSVAVFSDADAGSLHVRDADEAVHIGASPAAESYLDIARILAAAKATGAQAIHPGYGFLSESIAFADACHDAGIVFIGPTAANIAAFGLKHSARTLAAEQGVPLAPGSGLLSDVDAAASAAQDIGYPVILKATAGGGGIGMRICVDEATLRDGFAAVVRQATGNFGDGGVFLERYVPRARHIEVQVFGDGRGGVLALGERDCSLQRRNQKAVEETPAPGLPAATREAMIAAAVRLTAAADYASAGTVEFLYDADRDDFFFLEVNTRLQVEHGVTEQVTGIDLVEWMVRGAAGERAFLDDWDGQARGASIQVRLYAEDPAQAYRPSTGMLIDVAFPVSDRDDDIRVDGWIATGSEVSAFYDPMLAKLIVTAPDRTQAIAMMQRALDKVRLAGIETNLDWLRAVVRSDAFTTGDVSTRTLDDIDYRPATIQVLSGGPATTVQDHPGRLGYWDVGVPPSGPMDAFAFRLGNRMLDNPEGMAGLEFTAAGPTLRFAAKATICLTGARFDAALDGVPIEPYVPVRVAAGQVLKIGRVTGVGLRGYLLLAGGFDVPAFLGSRSTFVLGEFGGHAARAVATGDTLHLATVSDAAAPSALAETAMPAIERNWTIRVLSGPHGAPDFFTDDDIATLRSTDWRVHYNSNRTGVRLIGPKPHWARRDGGEAGLHPSNIHDNAYAIGAVDFTGDMPIILGPDGPSLGGFVCPLVVIQADLWKVGQLAPGDTLRFDVVHDEMAVAAEQAQDRAIATLTMAETPPALTEVDISPILRRREASGDIPSVLYRRQGDRNLLVEYGEIVLDLELRLRVHALMLEIERLALPGIIDVVPGIRSLQIHFDSRILSQIALLDALEDAEARLGGLDDFEIPSRVVYLPLSWQDPAIYETIDKYMQSVRDDAPWCPDNIEFIRRVNGLDAIDDVKRIVFDARYLVMGLGDVYLGAPVATPIDPRHRLVTTKYNPARTWTPPNVVGIGGAYMCIYGMEGPGGYQLFGRTIQVWNSWRETDAFSAGKPWLLRFFDQIRFFPVTHDELTEWRRDFPLGRRAIRIEEETFRLSEYRAFLEEHASGIEAFQAKRQAAFDAERADWELRGEFDRVAALVEEGGGDAAVVDIVVPDGATVVEAPFGASVWKMLVTAGETVAEGQPLAILEAMKMETTIPSPHGGVIGALYVEERQAVNPGSPMIAIQPA